MAEITKELGKRWKQLSEEERQAYKAKQQAATITRGAEEGEPAAHDACAGSNKPEEAGTFSAGGALPVSVVRKIIALDPDMGRVSKDAAIALTQTGELLLELLTEGCSTAAQRARPKRRTLKVGSCGTHAPKVALNNIGQLAPNMKTRIDDEWHDRLDELFRDAWHTG